MYRLRILPAATRDLERLDKPIARRIVARIYWLATNLENINPEPYKGDLVGLYKFRVGDYRVIYQILHDEQAIVIHQIGHRSEIYRKK
ncbi:MAG: type II toxin-antitoxin system RelE/ParE family toxin [Anaerolineae bacterium]|nr:type II toxin-antitoxin system RelE/ParE family toxin [Anaerolineae bacterium]